MLLLLLLLLLPLCRLVCWLLLVLLLLRFEIGEQSVDPNRTEWPDGFDVRSLGDLAERRLKVGACIVPISH